LAARAARVLLVHLIDTVFLDRGDAHTVGVDEFSDILWATGRLLVGSFIVRVLVRIVGLIVKATISFIYLNV
jgi:hypothetical protein